MTDEHDITLAGWLAKLQRRYYARTRSQLAELRLPADVYDPLVGEVVDMVMASMTAPDASPSRVALLSPDSRLYFRETLLISDPPMKEE